MGWDRRSNRQLSGCRILLRDTHLPVDVLHVVLCTQLGVEARQHVAKVVEVAHARRQFAANDAGEKLVGGEGHEATVGLVDEELGDGAGERLEGPPAWH